MNSLLAWVIEGKKTLGLELAEPGKPGGYPCCRGGFDPGLWPECAGWCGAFQGAGHHPPEWRHGSGHQRGRDPRQPVPGLAGKTLVDGAACLAAIPALLDHGQIKAGDEVVVFNTGSLEKYLPDLRHLLQ